jgi:hypothetical protein
LDIFNKEKKKMSTYGRETFETIGTGATVSADGNPKAKQGGITIYWDGIPAFVTAKTFESEDVVNAGEKYLRYGMIVCKIVGGTQAGKYVPYGTTVGAGNTIPDATSLSTARGDMFILNYSVHENDRVSDHLGAAIEGGRVFKKRLNIVGNTAIEYNATGPLTFTQVPVNTFEAAFPTITYVNE